jgi:hypothetical protein
MPVSKKMREERTKLANENWIKGNAKSTGRPLTKNQRDGNFRVWNAAKIK